VTDSSHIPKENAMSDDAKTLLHWIDAYRGQRCADEPIKNDAYWAARAWAAHIIGT